MTDKKYLSSFLEKLYPLGEATARMMIGDYCIYLNGKLIGLMCDNIFYLKKFKTNADFLKDCTEAPPYDGAKPLPIPYVGDEQFLLEAVRLTYIGAPEPKQRKK